MGATSPKNCDRTRHYVEDKAKQEDRGISGARVSWAINWGKVNGNVVEKGSDAILASRHHPVG